MKYLSEEVAYLRGLAEGLEIESATKEGKMICKIIDVLENLADTLDDMQDDYDELVEYVESVDEDLSDVEDILYEEDEDDGSGLSDEDIAMEAQDGDEEDEEMDSGEDEDEDEAEEDDLQPPRQKQNYLPDYLFKSALSSSSRPSKIVFNDSMPFPSTTSPQRRRKRAKRPSKDIVVG